MSINSTTVRFLSGRRVKESPSVRGAGRRSVPWATVLPLAALLSYADGFWMVSLRGAVGAIERTEAPFANWLRESTLVLPVFVFAVLGALALAQRRFGPVLRSSRTVLAAALLVVAAGTVAGIAEMAASSAYDFYLQSAQLQLMHSLNHTTIGRIQSQQATLGLQVRAVGFGSAILLVTNLVLVGWAVAMRGGRLNVSTTRAVSHAGRHGQGLMRSLLHGAASLPLPHRTPALRASANPVAGSTRGSRVDDLRLLLVAGLLATAVIHASVVPTHLTGWSDLQDPTSGGVFFILLAAAQLAVAALLIARPQASVVQAAAVVSVGPLALWLYSQAFRVQFGPGAGVSGQVGLADWAAGVLEVSTLLLAVVLLREPGWLRRPPTSPHVRALTLVAVIAVAAIGLAGSGLPGLDDFGSGSGLHGVELNRTVTHPLHPGA
jgi:hypothetical protein